ncbi:MAG: lysozyme [Caulobacter sp.]|nr:lysozyme [Caulobacter sp.]
MSKALFDAVRVVKGAPLTQADVDLINRAISGGVAAPVAPAAPASGLRVSRRGIDLIHSFEQLRLTAYKDPGSRNGLPITCGWGTTRDEDGGPIPLGAVWTKEKADRLFARDLAEFERGVNQLLAGAPTTQNQFDALVSFAYNVGLDIDDDTIAEGLGDSTLLRKHRAGDFAGARAQFAAWNKNDGKVMNGLVRRRAAEAALYGGAV